MRENWDHIFQQVLGHEGGYTAARNDRGNWSSGTIGKGQLKGTKYGISAAAYPSLDIKGLTVERAKAIYFKDYWTPIRGDDLPAGVDLVTFDAAVNSGRVRAVKWLQSAINADLKLDGLVGPATLAALAAAHIPTVIDAACARRLDFLEDSPLWNTFGKGWTARVRKIEKAAHDMTLKLPEATMPSQFFPELDSDKKPDKPFPSPTRVPRYELPPAGTDIGPPPAELDSQEPAQPVETQGIDSGLAVENLRTEQVPDIVSFIQIKLINGRLVSATQVLEDGSPLP